MRLARWTLVVSLVIGAVAPAMSADHPLDRASLTLTRSASGKEKLTFVANDSSSLFPVIASLDNPAMAGAILELASTAQPAGVAFSAPPGTGTPGWKVKDAQRDSYVYGNPAAAPGPTAIKVVTLKEGRGLKVVARGVGLALAGPQGTVGIRLGTGSLRNCARFDAPTIRQDVAGRFKATYSGGSVLVDCNDLLPPPPTTTTTSSTTSTTASTIVLAQCSGGSGFPTCGGSCPGDESCVDVVNFLGSPLTCLCYPSDVTPCRSSDYPSCGGTCPGGGVCQSMAINDVPFCGCVNPATPCGGGFSCQPGVCLGGVCRSESSGGAEFCSCGS
jgi:hypothetical protein